MHKLIENIITDVELEYLKGIFNSRDHVYSQGIDKVSLPLDEEPFKEFVLDLIKHRLGIDKPYEIVGDNFYKHSQSYFPHCDAIEDTAWLNIVLPIQRLSIRGEQKFIVFDQTWGGRNVTWIGDYDLKGDFFSNKKIKSRPCDGDFFENGTGQDLPDDIWQHIDQKFARDYFYSMSGTAYTWNPGNVIVFDSNHIHATGCMQSEYKIGVSIRIAHK